MQALRNIIVTGCNKGIGFGIVKHLASKEGWNIIMAVRNLELGQQAKAELLNHYPHAKIHLQKLDVSDSKSIDQFLGVIAQKYKPIHVLVNNAGVAAKGDSFDSQVINWTFKTNFYGTIQLNEKILPLLADSGKIISLGSTAGKMTFGKITNQNLKARWQKEGLTKDELFQLVHDFEDGVAKGDYAQRGWPKWGYGVSKLAINTYHNIFGQNPEVLKRNTQVYVCCPGYVKTDMTSQKGTLSIEQGILTPVHLIDLPFEVNKDLQGGFFYLQKKVSPFQ